MKITIVSTYPAKGSQNVGDALITNTTRSCLEDVLGEWRPLEIKTVWRADTWDNVRETLEQSDFIIFACLAIRPGMEYIEYPYLLKIMKTGIPYGILAAGTALIPDRTIKDQGFCQNTFGILREACKNAHFFTTRGIQTQQFCQQNGLTKARFVGDIAFYNSDMHSTEAFRFITEIKKIAISDPHFADFYAPAFCYLLKETQLLFPDAEIIVFLHGMNSTITDVVENYPEIICRKIYEDKNRGLDAYDEIDLHLGFRVHGHVSALKRKKASYLLEQDGRGLDYGLTIHDKISVPCHIIKRTRISLKNVLKALARRSKAPFFRHEVSFSTIDHLLAIVRQDREDGFKRIRHVESQIIEFNQKNRNVISTIKEIM